MAIDPVAHGTGRLALVKLPLGHFTGRDQRVDAARGEAGAVGAHALPYAGAIGIVLAAIGEVIAGAGGAHAGVDRGCFGDEGGKRHAAESQANDAAEKIVLRMPVMKPPDVSCPRR